MWASGVGLHPAVFELRWGKVPPDLGGAELGVFEVIVEARAEAAGDGLARRVFRVDEADRRFPSQNVIGMGAGGLRGLCGIAVAPGLGHERPADLRLGPAERVPQADAAEIGAGLFEIDPPEAIAAHHPVAEYAADGAPNLVRPQRATDKARGVRGPKIELLLRVRLAGRAQDETLGLEPGYVEREGHLLLLPEA